MIKAEGGNFNVMSKGQQYQCQECGTLRWSKEPLNIEDDLFTKMKCKHCQKETNHLWVGEDEMDLYVMYNVNVDPRYYYNSTK